MSDSIINMSQNKHVVERMHVVHTDMVGSAPWTVLFALDEMQWYRHET